MKHLTLTLAAFALMACGTQTQKNEKTPWPVEPRNEQVEYMMMLDSVNNVIVGDRYQHSEMEMQTLATIGDEPMTPQELEAMINKTYADAEELA